MLATRNLLYTGITRGKRAVVLLGTKQTISKMIANNIIIKRNSMLLTFLRQEAEFNQ
jgi:exodeoxyribonuclease V alpha subunit